MSKPVDNWKANVDAYLADLAESPVRTLEEMITFNEEHGDVCLPPGKSS